MQKTSHILSNIKQIESGRVAKSTFNSRRIVKLKEYLTRIHVKDFNKDTYKRGIGKQNKM